MGLRGRLISSQTYQKREACCIFFDNHHHLPKTRCMTRGNFTIVNTFSKTCMVKWGNVNQFYTFCEFFFNTSYFTYNPVMAFTHYEPHLQETLVDICCNTKVVVLH